MPWYGWAIVAYVAVLLLCFIVGTKVRVFRKIGFVLFFPVLLPIMLLLCIFGLPAALFKKTPERRMVFLQKYGFVREEAQLFENDGVTVRLRGFDWVREGVCVRYLNDGTYALRLQENEPFVCLWETAFGTQEEREEMENLYRAVATAPQEKVRAQADMLAKRASAFLKKYVKEILIKSEKED